MAQAQAAEAAIPIQNVLEEFGRSFFAFSSPESVKSKGECFRNAMVEVLTATAFELLKQIQVVTTFTLELIKVYLNQINKHSHKGLYFSAFHIDSTT